MAKATYLNNGRVVSFTATTPVKYMEVVTMEKRIGVAMEAIAKNEVGDVSIVGAYRLPKEKTAEIKAGAVVFFDAGEVKTTGTVVAGVALEDAGNGKTTVAVRID